MKVAYVLPTLQNPSGWRSHARAFLGEMRTRVEAVVFAARGDVEDAQAFFPGLPVYPLPATQQFFLGSPRGLAALAATYRAIRSGNFPQVDLVHSLEAYPTGLVGSWLARRLGCPHILTAHGTYGVCAYERRLDHLAYTRVLQSARLLCTVSEGTAEMIRRYYGPDLEHTRVQPILNGNDFYRTVPPEEAENHAWPSTPILLSVGEVKARKGQHLSLAAFARLKARLPEAEYWIAGRYNPDGPYFGLLQNFIRQQRLEGVHFLGAVSDAELRRHYQGSSLFVLTPDLDGFQFEGFGLVYLEAGAYGLPVVATRSGGVPAAVKDGETGLLAEAGDVNGIAEAMFALLADPERARRMGRANRRWAETLTWERCAGQYLQSYTEARLG